MISLENITKKFGNKIVIENISFHIKKQEITAIIGPSGAGKSSVLRCISWLDEPSSGSIYIDGIKITKRNLRKIRKTVGMVFQYFYLFPHLTVIDNLTYAPLVIAKKNKQDICSKAEHLLKKFDIENKKNEMPLSLSGGQRQRVAIARSLMLDPEILLLDEPTSALDAECIKDVALMLEELKQEVTIIFVTHNLNLARRIADRIIFMDHGKILDNQEKQKFFEDTKSFRAKLFIESSL